MATSELLEKRLEGFIAENPDFMESRGLENCFYKNIKRQLRIRDAGICDIFTYELVSPTHISFRIIELKKDCISLAALEQLTRYISWSVEDLKKSFSKVTFSGILIGNDFSSDIVDIRGFLRKNIRLYSYSYEHDGLSFRKISPNVFTNILDSQSELKNLLFPKE